MGVLYVCLGYNPTWRLLRFLAKVQKSRVKYNNKNSSTLSLGHSPLPLALYMTQTGHDISVSIRALVFSLLFMIFHLSLAAISQLRQTPSLFHSMPPIRRLHVHVTSRILPIALLLISLTCACLSMHSAAPSIITGIHLRCSREQIHSLAVALSKIDLCVSHDTSGAFKKWSLPSGGGREDVSSVRLSWRHYGPFSAYRIQTGWDCQRPARLRFHPTNINVHLIIPHHFIPHELWIWWVKKTFVLERRAEEEGDWDRGWSHQRIIAAILVIFPKVSEEGEFGKWRSWWPRSGNLHSSFWWPTSLRAINPHVTFG